jgi:hypothetical protein
VAAIEDDEDVAGGQIADRAQEFVDLDVVAPALAFAGSVGLVGDEEAGLGGGVADLVGAGGAVAGEEENEIVVGLEFVAEIVFEQ